MSRSAATYFAITSEDRSRSTFNFKKFKDEARDRYNDLSRQNPNPLFHARLYQECVADNGAMSTGCAMHKERWLELMAEKNGNKVAWNEEEINKIIKEDAIKGGYIDGFNPNLFHDCAIMKCMREYGVQIKRCEGFNKCLDKCKAAAIKK